MVNTAGCASPQVSQRLKRRPTIIDKLRREPAMMLGRMQDIGGCRAVLNDLEEVVKVHARIRRTGRIKRVRDYIQEPAESGYRSIHVIVAYDERLIEVQLRTQVQHQWAVTVERLGGRLHQDIKGGEGRHEIHDLLRAISEAMRLEEGGEVVEAQMNAELGRLRAAAEPFLAPGRK
jgi:ppGpp synthetase/RelA/SpoT-type nucleotidyltranferase